MSTKTQFILILTFLGALGGLVAVPLALYDKTDTASTSERKPAHWPPHGAGVLLPEDVPAPVPLDTATYLARLCPRPREAETWADFVARNLTWADFVAREKSLIAKLERMEPPGELDDFHSTQLWGLREMRRLAMEQPQDDVVTLEGLVQVMDTNPLMMGLRVEIGNIVLAASVETWELMMRMDCYHPVW